MYAMLTPVFLLTETLKMWLIEDLQILWVIYHLTRIENYQLIALGFTHRLCF